MLQRKNGLSSPFEMLRDGSESKNCGFGVAKGNNADHVNQNCVESRFDGNEQVKSGS